MSDFDDFDSFDGELEEEPDLEAQRPGIDVETLLQRIGDLVANARPMPLSASVMINRDEVLELVEEALARMPDEVREARWLLKEREDFLAKVQREGDDILDAARLRAERMVERTEVVRGARQTARKVLEDADYEARRLRHEAEDFCDQKLAQFEIVLDRTSKMVQAGRARLSTAVAPAHDAAPEDVGAALFDQDIG
jgi:F0F1-type ATP synthase membrane subunit b/b'